MRLGTAVVVTEMGALEAAVREDRALKITGGQSGVMTRSRLEMKVKGREKAGEL